MGVPKSVSTMRESVRFYELDKAVDFGRDLGIIRASLLMSSFLRFN
jgi:hypothetical protein